MNAPSLGGEAGAVLVWLAFTLGTTMLIATFAIDVGNLFRHQRQLQTMADAAALAGATKLQPAACDSATVKSTADLYTGDPDAGALYNVPVEADDVSRQHLIADPCDPKTWAIKVELTEDDVDWLIPVTGLLAKDVQARAKVELQKIVAMENTVPLVVRDQKVHGVDMYLVDESSGAGSGDVIAGPVAMTGTPEGDDVRWSSAADPVAAQIGGQDVGVRFKVRYVDEDGPCPTNAASSSNYECFDAESDFGISHIHGYAAGTPVAAQAVPQLRRTLPAGPAPVQLTSANCFGGGIGCLVQITATVDWVDAVDAELVTAANSETVAAVNARVGAGGTPVALTYVKPVAAGVEYPLGKWVGTLAVPSLAGYNGIFLDWKQLKGAVGTSNAAKCDADDPCIGEFRGSQAAGVVAGGGGLSLAPGDYVHKFFVGAASRSGETVEAGLVSHTPATGTAGVGGNSVDSCATAACKYSFAAEIVLPADLKLGDREEIAVSGVGSNDQLLNCDPTQPGIDNVGEYVAGGCDRTFGIDADGECSTGEQLAEISTCVSNFTPNSSNQIERGMTGRIYNDGVVAPANFSPTVAQCSENPNLMAGGDLNGWMADLESPRIVAVVVSEDPGQGAGLIPVNRFAYFYVTGWGDNPCENHGGNEKNVESGHIAGRFIQYAPTNDGGVFGRGVCPEMGLDPCVAVMTE